MLVTNREDAILSVGKQQKSKDHTWISRKSETMSRSSIGVKSRLRHLDRPTPARLSRMFF
jgi:hypothetical protein